MKRLLALALPLWFASCATVTRPDGSKQTVLTPQGAQVVQGLFGTAIGAGVGWAVEGKPQGALTGGLSAGAGQLAGYVIGPMLPQAATRTGR